MYKFGIIETPVNRAQRKFYNFRNYAQSITFGNFKSGSYSVWPTYSTLKVSALRELSNMLNLSSKESGGPWPSENATRYGQVAFVCAIAQKISVHGASMTNLTTYALEKRTLFKMKEMHGASCTLHIIIFPAG